MDSDAELAEALQKLEHTDQGEPAERGQMSDLVGLSGLSGMGRGGIPGTNSGPFSRTTYMTTATRTQGMGRGGIPGTNSGPFSTTTYMATATRTQGPYGHMGGGVESVSTLYSRSDFGGFDMRGDMSSRSPGGEGYQGPPGMHEYMQRSDIYGSIGQGRAIQQGKVPGMTGMTGSLSQGARMPGMTGLMGQGAGMPGMRGLMSQGAGMPGMTGSLSQGARMPGMAGAMGHGKGQEMPGSMYGMPNAGSRGRGQRQDALIELLEREKIKAQTCEDSLAHGANTIIILDTSASMLGEPFQEAVEAIENFLLGLEENAMEYGLEENVGLITFGSEDQTGVVQHMTNDFSKIRDAMGNLTPGGMSPLSAALFCILGLFGRIQSVNVSGHVIPARVIIVSDGNVNEGPDTGVDICMDQNTFLEISNNVMDLAHNITEKTKVKMYFIPVGNPNEVIPDMLTAVTGGSVVLAGDVKWLSRSYIHHIVVGILLQQIGYDKVDRSAVEMAVNSRFSILEDRDIDAIMDLHEEEKRNHTSLGSDRSSHPSMQGTKGLENPMKSKAGPYVEIPGTKTMTSGDPVSSQAGPNVGIPGMSPMTSGYPVSSQAGPNVGIPGMSPMTSGDPFSSQAGPNAKLPKMSSINSGCLVTEKPAGTVTGESNNVGQKSAITNQNADLGTSEKQPVQKKETDQFSNTTTTKDMTLAGTNQQSNVTDKYTSSINYGFLQKNTESETSGSEHTLSQSEYESDDGRNKGAQPKRKMKWNQLKAESNINQTESKQEPKLNQKQEPKQDLRQEPNQELRQEPKQEPLHEAKQNMMQKPNQDLNQESKQEAQQEPNQYPKLDSKQESDERLVQDPKQELTYEQKQEPKHEPTYESSMAAPNVKSLPQNNSNVDQNMTSQNKGEEKTVTKNKSKWNVLSSSKSENTGKSSNAGQNISLKDTTEPNNTGQNKLWSNDSGQSNAKPKSEGQNGTGIKLDTGLKNQTHGNHLRHQQLNTIDFQQNTQPVYQLPSGQAGGQFIGQGLNPYDFQQNTQPVYQLPNGQAGSQFIGQQLNPFDIQQNPQHWYQCNGYEEGASNAGQRFKQIEPSDQKSIEERLKKILEQSEKNKQIREAGDASEEKEIEKVKIKRQQKGKKKGKGYDESLNITFDDITRQAEKAVGYGKPPKPIEKDMEPENKEQEEQTKPKIKEPQEKPEQEKTSQRQKIKLEDLLRMQRESASGENQQTLFHGLMGNQEKQQQLDEITEEKIKDLLEKYGTGPSKTDNLPNMPRINLRVTTGPNWMWKQNGVQLNAKGTVISIDKEDKGWVKVRWDNGVQEDYRYGLDNEFDIQPLEGGMEAVDWPPGKERIVSQPEWLDELESDEFEDDDEEAPEESSAQSEKEIKKKNSEEAEPDNNTSGDQASAPALTTPPVNPPADAGASGDQSSLKTCFVWQYKDDENIWRTYPLEIQKQLEKTYIKRNGKGSAVIQMDGKTERVIFHVEKGIMEQRNADKQTTRSVQRIEADAEKLQELQEIIHKTDS